MTGTPSRAAPAARNGSARVAARHQPARRQQQPAAGSRRRCPHRHHAELGPPLRHRRRGARDRRHRSRHRAGRPAGITGSGLVLASSTVKNARTSSVRPQNRRSHPRTVSAGRPSRPAILRCPSPAAAASSAAPITAAASARRDMHHAGSSTCVPPHPRHRDLRGISATSGPSRTRTRRSSAFPHPPSTPPHDGQASSPPASCRSTTSRSPFTVSTTPPSVNSAALPRASPKITGRAAPYPTCSPCWPTPKSGNPQRCPCHFRNVSDANSLLHRHLSRPGTPTLTPRPPARHSHRHGAAADENPATRPPATSASASPVPLQPQAMGILSAVEHRRAGR